jgi:hypothetical protein
MPPKKAAAAKPRSAPAGSKALPVQSAGPGMMFSKESFFLPKRGPDGGKIAVPQKDAHPPVDPRFPQRFQPQRRFIRDRNTGEAYAEWINDVAVCIHTGVELFRSRRSEQYAACGEGDACGAPMVAAHDYSVPKQRHPNDFSVSTDEVLASGFITVDDFKPPDGAAIRLRDYEAFLARKQ